MTLCLQPENLHQLEAKARLGFIDKLEFKSGEGKKNIFYVLLKSSSFLNIWYPSVLTPCQGP